MASKLDKAVPARSLGLAVGILATAVLGCGGSSEPTSSSSRASQDASSGNAATASSLPRATRTDGYLKLDGDADNDDQPHPVKAQADELPLLRSFGDRANAADKRAIASLVKSFYGASAAGDGARACALMYSSLADELAVQHGNAAGAPAACAKPMSALLRGQHRRLVTEDPSTMAVVAVHVTGGLGLAVLGFKTTPESQIVVEREVHTWKVDALFGTYMP